MPDDTLTLGTPPDGARLGKLLTADYTAAINTTATMSVTERPVAGLSLVADRDAMLYVMVKGANAGCSKAITLTLAISPDGGQAGRIGNMPMIFTQGVDQCVNRLKQGRGGMGGTGADKDPAAFLAPFRNACIAQDFNVAGHARLALRQHLGQFPDRQFHRPQQLYDAQPCRVSKGPEDIEHFRHKYENASGLNTK